MSDKTHCDLCDQVIPPTVQHLTLLVGWWAGRDGDDEQEPRDFCPACIAKEPLLARFFNQRLDAKPKRKAAKTG